MPAAYEQFLVPVVFQPFAEDMAARAAALRPRRILELAAGTGVLTSRLLGALPSAGVIATDLNEAMVAFGSTRAPGAVWRQADAERLPFPDASFDTVALTLVLCTVPDPDAALRETARVLKPGGRFLFLEHVRSEDAKLARWQDRLHGPWYAFGHGCNCNRDTAAAIERSPLRVERLERGAIPKMPPLVKPLLQGSALAPDHR